MTTEEHQRRHRFLYESLAELMADYKQATGIDPLSIGVREFANWTKQQSEEPDHKAK